MTVERLTPERLAELRPEVAAFARLMEAKLRKNDHKGGWNDCAADWLLGRLIDEVVELQDAMSRGDRDGVVAEATDVANFAMMIADVLGALSEETFSGLDAMLDAEKRLGASNDG